MVATRPFENLIERLAIDHCGFEYEHDNGEFWEVTFRFKTAEHAAMFGQAVQAHNL